MRALTEAQLFRAVKRLPFKVERFPEGTVRFELPRSRLREVPLDELKSLPFSGCYLIGREATPPLADAKTDDISSLTLRRSRVAAVRARGEFMRACQEIMQHGSNVDHDVYVLDMSALWMLYLSHHDEVLLYEANA
jgi:hypothetical protein